MAAAAPGFDPRKAAAAARRAFWRAAAQFEQDVPPLLERRPVATAGADGPLEARLYVPYAAGAVSPGLVYFHGGGFMTGDLDSHDMICRRLAASARMRVVSVAYRLAPAHKFPAAPEDCIAATQDVIARAAEFGFDPARVGVAGDSAGGALAAVTTIAFARRGLGRLKAQILIYPCTQLVLMTPSQLKFEQAHAVAQAAQDWVVRQYLPDREVARDWRASPLFAEDLRGLAPAFVLTAGLDPLLDEGKAYADKLAAFGVETRYVNKAGEPHGFFNMTAVSRSARAAIAEVGRWAAEALSR